jgi:tripartite-type tricarboxylate transporter receptor subunit TctC
MKRILSALAAVLCLAAAIGPATAQDKYPSRPIKMIVPFAPAGATDIAARIIVERMRETLGQPIVIENKPGAGGLIGLEELARAKPDGYTILLGNNNTNVITPILYRKKFTVDPEKDMIPIALVCDLPSFVIATKKNFPVATLPELVAWAKQNDGKLRFNSIGVGSFPHLDMEMLGRRAGFTGIHIPIKSGAGGMLNDLVTGDAQAAFLNVATARSMVRAGEVRALAVISETRLPEYPDVPTLRELGYPGIGTIQWFAIFVPKGLPAAIIDRIHATTVEAVNSPGVKERFKQQEIRSTPSANPGEAQEFVADQFVFWRKFFDEVKIEMPE